MLTNSFYQLLIIWLSFEDKVYSVTAKVKICVLVFEN